MMTKIFKESHKLSENVWKKTTTTNYYNKLKIHIYTAMKDNLIGWSSHYTDLESTLAYISAAISVL